MASPPSDGDRRPEDGEVRQDGTFPEHPADVAPRNPNPNTAVDQIVQIDEVVPNAEGGQDWPHLVEDGPMGQDGDHVDSVLKRPLSVEEQKEIELSQRYQTYSFWRRYLVEFIFMLYVFPTMLNMTSITDVFLHKACLYNLEYNETVCNHLDNNTMIKEDVQIVSNHYTTMRSIVSTIPGAAASLIAGQYMSRYGMKKPLLIAIAGTMFTNLLQMYTYYYMSLPLYYSVLAELPGAFTGGLIVFMTAVYTNISVSCPSDKRKGRFLMIQFFMFLPMVAAMGAGGYLYSKIGILYMTAGACTIQLLPFSLLLLFFKDVGVNEQDKNDDWSTVIRHSAGLRVLKQSFNYLIRPRPDYARAQLYCMFVCLCIGVMGFSGATELNFVYINLLYKWDVSHYSMVNSLSMVAVFVLSIPNMLLFTKVLKLSDPTMISVGFTFFAFKFFIMSIIFLGRALFYLQVVIGLPFIVSMVGIRAHMSRLLAPHEIAVVFSLTSAFERLVPIGADAVTMIVYEKSVHFFPGLVFAAQGAFFLIPAILAVFCSIWTRRYGFPEYATLVEENPEETNEKSEKEVNSSGAACSAYA